MEQAFKVQFLYNKITLIIQDLLNTNNLEDLKTIIIWIQEIAGIKIACQEISVKKICLMWLHISFMVYLEITNISIVTILLSIFCVQAPSPWFFSFRVMIQL